MTAQAQAIEEEAGTSEQIWAISDVFGSAYFDRISGSNVLFRCAFMWLKRAAAVVTCLPSLKVSIRFQS